MFPQSPSSEFADALSIHFEAMVYQLSSAHELFMNTYTAVFVTDTQAYYYIDNNNVVIIVIVIIVIVVIVQLK